MHIEKREREKIDRRIIKEKKRKAKNMWKIYVVVFFSLSSSKKNKNINKRNPGCVQSDELIVPILYPLICRPRVKMRRISVRLLYNLLLFIFVPLLFTHKQQKKRQMYIMIFYMHAHTILCIIIFEFIIRRHLRKKMLDDSFAIIIAEITTSTEHLTFSR